MQLHRPSLVRHCRTLPMAMALLAWLMAVHAFGEGSENRTDHPTPAIEQGSETAEPRGARASATAWATQAQEQTFRLDDGTSIRLAPNSEVLRRAMVQVALGLQEASPMVHSLELVKGTLEVEVSAGKLPFHGVLVRAPKKVGAIFKTGRGTITSNGSETTVAARNGRDMMVSVAEHWRGLRVGRAFSVSAAEPQGSQRPILHAPALAVQDPVVLALGQGVARHRIQWQPVPGSNAYVVRLTKLGGTEEVVLSEQRTTSAEFVVEGLGPGRYQARVAALDSYELPSEFGTAVGFRVVEAVLPDGASATDKGIRLPAHERILLRGIEDLELTYGLSSNMFLPAPGSIGLHDGRGVIVRLRDKGSSKETRLNLEPVDCVLGVSLQPSRATWPGPPVEIRVSMRRSDGTPSPELENLVPSVTINAQPVAATWQRATGELRALIEQPPVRGPWILRIVVRDRRDRALLRDFLEVAEQRAVEN